MRIFLFLALIFSISVISCKKEHPDLKAAFELFQDAQNIKKSILISHSDLRNQAQAVDNKIRNEDKESVYAIAELYTHLELAEKQMKALEHSERGIPGHENEAKGLPILSSSLEPAAILVTQKNYRDSLILVKTELDAATTLLNHLKAKFN